MYVVLTYLPGYSNLPAVDFLFLLILGLLILGTNVVLWQEAAQLGGDRYANVAINNSIVSAFAAIALSDRIRWFLAWLACHAAGFSTVLLFLEASSASRAYATLSYLIGAAIALFINWSLGKSQRTAYAMRAAVEVERKKTEQLLYNVLPRPQRSGLEMVR